MQPTNGVSTAAHGVLDVLWATIELLTSPSEPGAVYCVIKGTIPPGVSVPLHSHPDPESFFVVSGTAEVLTQRGDRLEWLNVKAGDFVHIPGGAKHAHRNRSNAPVVELVTTTPTLGRFFQEVGRPVTSGAPLPPPTPDEFVRLERIAGRYQHWLATPEENAAVGITLPPG